MKSMTGFGQGAAASGPLRVVVEAYSVNRRNLDLNVSLPREWQALEIEIGAMVRKEASRGRIQISVRVEPVDAQLSDWFDAGAVEKGFRQLAGLGQKLGVEIRPDGPLLAAIASATQRRPELPSLEEARHPVMEATGAALEGMNAMRAREGRALESDCRTRLGIVRDIVSEIRGLSAEVAPTHGELLFKRLRQAGLEIDLNDDRVLREIALFADRCDVSEEITRLESHFGQMETFFSQTAPVGRQIEFLLQEIGREFNTIGAKANDAGITKLVIAGKTELERVREQGQNIE